MDKETMDLVGGEIVIPFYGSPVISLACNATLLLSSRLERFRCLGPPYPYDNPTHQVFELPHGILAGSPNSPIIQVATPEGTIIEIAIRTKGATGQYVDDGRQVPRARENKLAGYVLAWSQFFDDILEQAQKKNRFSDEVRWGDILDFFDQLAKEPDEPRKSLIVDIAQNMRSHLTEVVATARKILLRERKPVPIPRMQESDTYCLRWYVRQPGRTFAEKAGNKQRLLAVVRREFYNTLENQVLKDFLVRSKKEAVRYLQNEAGDPRFFDSTRARDVRAYKSVCRRLHYETFFETISLPSPGTRPNYVLQNDDRYRKVWSWYVKLLRRVEEHDQIWDWQPRLWADIIRIFVGAAMELGRAEQQNKPRSEANFLYETIVKSHLRVRHEQSLGGRIYPGSEPGPFLLSRIENGQPTGRAVIELIHPDLANQHPEIKYFGRTGGHLYLVIHPLESQKRRKIVLIIWSVNGAGAEVLPEPVEVARSAYNALQQHRTFLKTRSLFSRSQVCK